MMVSYDVMNLFLAGVGLHWYSELVFASLLPDTIKSKHCQRVARKDNSSVARTACNRSVRSQHSCQAHTKSDLPIAHKLRLQPMAT